MSLDNGKKPLSVGAEFFDSLITDKCYYVDKTDAIAELLRKKARVTLFTRPRRFGKTLFMTTLKNFFEIGTDPELFEGLKISEEKELCERHQGKYPVIFISLKSVEALDYAGAYAKMKNLLIELLRRFDYLCNSDRLSDIDKKQLDLLLREAMDRESVAQEVMEASLYIFSNLLEKHWGRKTVILIDEYDVPLDAAYRNGYYDKMVGLIRGMFGNALKTNESLAFAVLTGCLWIAKESIFTGTNNFDVWTVTHKEFNTTFGFTEEEVKDMLSYYERQELYEPAKEWYDGYRFGESAMFCPWDVIKYVSRNYGAYRSEPENYWANTSGNALLLDFIEKMDMERPRELEALIAGEMVQKRISQELTYRELADTEDNLWSILYMTGYLTTEKLPQGGNYSLVIPNREIRNLIVGHVQKLFERSVKKDVNRLNDFVRAIECGDAEQMERLFTEYLREHISIRDTNIKREMKENFYHGYLLGILSAAKDVYVCSNREGGDGYADLIIEVREMGAVIEVKYAEDNRLDYWAGEALKQINEKRYAESFDSDEVETIRKYGVACYKRKCRVVIE